MVMMRKTLYLEGDDVDKLASKLGLCDSESVRYAVAMLAGSNLEDIEWKLKLSLLDKEIEENKKTLETLKVQCDTLINSINVLSEQRVIIQQGYDNIIRTHILTTSMQSLNKLIIESHFNLEFVTQQGSEIITAIKSLNPTFDISIHINRLKDILDL